MCFKVAVAVIMGNDKVVYRLHKLEAFPYCAVTTWLLHLVSKRLVYVDTYG